MLVSSGGTGSGSPIKTRNGVDVVEVDALVAMLSGGKSIFGWKMPDTLCVGMGQGRESGEGGDPEGEKLLVEFI